ncbi:subclass B3 metallo-beta-lactamase [Sphingomonas jaspsi]|uniref:subclass B3 metallo-beta-lactamase n=1 Tax=Sphingomonas jaspsi TaxID=392409 RepID=UPI0004BA194D|nr:subclass B3 metallo-beta-lactamase [Sphingomonas jaspsi]
MFASLIALALVQTPIVTIPLGKKPRQIERPRAPIEEAGPAWADACKGNSGWDAPGPPVRIHGNTYYVGTCGISAILITGDKGHILIDSGTEKGVDTVIANIRALGFRPADVKILLHSHEHIDHVGGMSVLQQATGAQLYASPTAARVFATGAPTADDPQAGLMPPFRAARVDRTVRDGEEIRLGNLNLVAMATPGHTLGAMSWRWVSCDGGVCPTIVYADSLSAISRDDYKYGTHPDLVAAFRASLAKIAASDCDILITPHPDASDMPARFEGLRPLRDPDACKAYAEAKGKALDERLKKEADPQAAAEKAEDQQ